MTQHCTDEIESLHRFFVEWFRGDQPRTMSAFERVATVLAPDFEIIAPDGRMTTREPLIEQLFALHGSRATSEPPFEIWTQQIKVRELTPDLYLATYEEWQAGDQGRKGRHSTALLATNAKTPNGVEWRHVHETWLPSA